MTNAMNVTVEMSATRTILHRDRFMKRHRCATLVNRSWNDENGSFTSVLNKPFLRLQN